MTAPARNVEIQVVVPKNDRLKFIIAEGYTFPTGIQTKRVVTRADADAMAAESGRSIEDPISKKVVSMQRFTILIGDETDKPAEAKNRQIGAAKLEFRKNPLVEQTEALRESVGLLVASLAKQADAMSGFTGKLSVAR